MQNPFEEISERLSRIERCLMEIKSSSLTSKEKEEPDIIGIKQTSLLLGYSVQTIYKKVYLREIPFIKKDGVKPLFFSRKRLLEWVKEGEQPTKEEIKKQATKSLEK